MTSFFVVKKGAAGTGGAGTSGVFGPAEDYGELPEDADWGYGGFEGYSEESQYYFFGGEQTNKDYGWTPGTDAWVTLANQNLGGGEAFQSSVGLATSFYGTFMQIMGGGGANGYDSGWTVQYNRRYLPASDSYITSTSYPLSLSGIGIGKDYWIGTMTYGGKITSSNTTPNAYFYNADDDTFTSKTSMTAGRSHFATGWTVSYENVLCGKGPINSTNNQNWGYDGPVFDSWTTFNDVTTNFSITTSSTPGSNCAFGGQGSSGMQVCGGYSSTAGAVAWNRLYDGTLTDTWQGSTSVPQALTHMGGCAGRTFAYLVGGRQTTLAGSQTSQVYRWGWVSETFTNYSTFSGGNCSAVSGCPGPGK